MPINLKKTYQPGTWRYIGTRVAGFAPADVPIAGVSLEAICAHFGGVPYRIGRVRPQNAFVLERGNLRLMYVRPEYTAYRAAARKVFKSYEWRVDFDHVLGRVLARRLGYNYVLLTRANPGVNRSHGRFERLAIAKGDLPRVCFVDRRIQDKVLGRTPLARRSEAPSPYDPRQADQFGLTLKQAGRWGYALGVDDELRPLEILRPIELPLSEAG